MSEPFDPTPFLSRIGGAEYLEVKWRIKWFRDQHPDGTIEAELVHFDQEWAVARSTITIPSGGKAVDYGSENIRDFKDHIEKAITKAHGRALAALGFGTQFCPDHEFGAQVGKVVDAPIRHQRTNAPRPESATAAANGPEPPASQRQLHYLLAVGREHGFDPDAIDRASMEQFGTTHHSLSRRDASTLIDLIQRDDIRPSAAPAPVPVHPDRPAVGPPPPLRNDVTDTTPKVEQSHISHLHGAGAKWEWDHERLTRQAHARYGVNSLKDLTQMQYAHFLEKVKRNDAVDEIPNAVPTEQ